MMKFAFSSDSPLNNITGKQLKEICEFWLKIRREAIAEEREQYKPLMIEGGKDEYLFVKIPGANGDFSLFYKSHLTQE